MNKRTTILVCLFVLLQCMPTHAQKWAVHFTDKDNSVYSVDNPREFLTQRSIDRRNKFGIEVTEEDLPVNENYVEQLVELGAEVLGTSKWLNFALIHAEESIKTLIEQLDFVDKVVYVSPDESEAMQFSDDYVHEKWKHLTQEDNAYLEDVINEMIYGSAYTQINQVNGIPLHEKGYTGEGILITVIDAGFENADQIGGFQHIWDRNGIVFVYDVVNPKGNVYEEHLHGTAVMSCMGGKIEGSFLGTAPDADYALIRTEYFDTEYLIEEYNLVIGLELADSIGTDIINVSLGYSVFDDPSMNHDYETDMDGQTTVSSIAASMAIERGIFICAANGNSNHTDFPWMGTPADVPEVLSIGGVMANGYFAPFSSLGPNSTGYPKPDVVALAFPAYSLFPDNLPTYSAGTSFASPIVCGLVACLMQAYPLIPPVELKEMIVRTGSYYGNHQIDYGYGIPDFDKVYNDYTGIPEINRTSKIRIFPNPVKDILHFNTDAIVNQLNIMDASGRIVLQKNIDGNKLDVSMLNNGLYFVVFYTANGDMITKKIMITP